MRASVSDPVVILNNWVRGNDVKVARAKSWHHWFLSDSEHECNAADFSSRSYPPEEIPEHLIMFAISLAATSLVCSFLWHYRNKMSLFAKKWTKFERAQNKI